MAYGIDRPTYTTEVKATILVSSDSVTVQVWEYPTGGGPGVQLWIRVIKRPADKTDQQCVAAAVNALGAGVAGWLDTVGQRDVPLDGVVW